MVAVIETGIKVPWALGRKRRTITVTIEKDVRHARTIRQDRAVTELHKVTAQV
jgi:hypothetical protein